MGVLAEGIDRQSRVLSTKYGISRDEDPGSRECRRANRGGVDTTVDLQDDLMSTRIDRSSRLGDLWKHLRDKRLASKSWKDAHDQEQVDLVEEGRDSGKGGVRIENQSNPEFEFAHLDDQLSGFPNLDMN